MQRIMLLYKLQLLYTKNTVSIQNIFLVHKCNFLEYKMQFMYTKDNISLLNTNDTVKCSSTKENTSSKLRTIQWVS